MLSSVFIQNFRSITELKVDFSFTERKLPEHVDSENSIQYLHGTKQLRLVPCLAFFGANASGKTNILLSLQAVRHIVGGGVALSTCFQPNLLNPKFTTTTLRVTMLLPSVEQHRPSGEKTPESDGAKRRFDVYTYHVEYSKTAIVEELLEKDGKRLFFVREGATDFSKQICSETYTATKLAEIFRVECTDGKGSQVTSFLHRIGTRYKGLHPSLTSAFAFFTKGIIVIDNTKPTPLPQVIELLATAMGSDETIARTEIVDHIRRLDFDITDIQITKQRVSDGDAVGTVPGLESHNIETGECSRFKIDIVRKRPDGGDVAFDYFKHESVGTQRLVCLVGVVLYALKTGSVLIVDELESSVHALLTREIVLLFKRSTRNPLGAQLIFTTHSTELLDDSLFGRSEIALVRKTLVNGTIAQRLIDKHKHNEKIPSVSKFRSEYLQGLHAAVPHPSI